MIEQTATQSSERQFCTFWVDGKYFGVDVGHVQEVVRFQRMTRVPLAPRMVSGLINLRGQIVTAIDLRQRLGLAPRAAGARPMNVIVRRAEGAVSLLVDEIGEVLSVGNADFEELPDTASEVNREFIEGIYKLDRRLLLVLDAAKATGIAAAQDKGDQRERNVR